MSYSFSVKAASAAEIVGKIDAEFDRIVEGQPTHATDREQAKAAALAFAALLTEPSDDEELCVSVSGSLSWKSEGVYVSASVNAHAYFVKKEQVPE